MPGWGRVERRIPQENKGTGMSDTIEFRLSENPWSPTDVVAELNARTGSGLTLIGLADQVGGTSGAAFVAWPDGRQAALTRTRIPLPHMQQTARVLNEVRDRGLPVPAHQVLIELSDGWVAVVQERMPGRHVDRLDRTTAAAFVAMSDRFAGLLRRHPDVPPPAAFPDRGPGYGEFEYTIGRLGPRGRRLLDRLLQIDGGKPFRMRGDDLVHVDYSPGNVLFDDMGRVTGVVDWNMGVARGDRRYALVGLSWTSVGRSTVPAAELALIDEALADLDPEVRRSYEAHRVVQHVHSSISKGFPEKRIRSDLEFAEEMLG
ncbi:MAG TPA: aminoglycoside phosphotransferase family protein [Actinopolymorphaceae bacterium]